MTDNQGLIPNSVGLSDDLLYNLKPSSGTGKSYRVSVQPTNKSIFAPADSAIIYIPCGRRGTFLDTQQSYIKYTIWNQDPNNAVKIDGTGACVINRLDVFHGSNLLETVQQYNVLYNFLMDFNMSATDRLGASSIFGFDGTAYDVGNIRVGASLGVSNATTFSAAGTNNRLTVCMPILSGVIGMGLDKMLPVGYLSDDIRCEFVFESTTQGMVYANTNATQVSWAITGVELELCYVELGDDSLSIVNSVSPLNGPLFLHGNSFRHYTSTVPAGSSGQFSCLVPQRFASTKGLIMCPRRGTEIASTAVGAQSYSISSRCNFNIETYWFRVGSALIPSKFVVLSSSTGQTASGYAEGYMEIQKFFHSCNTPLYSGCLPFSYYNVNENANSAVGAGGVVALSTTADSYKNGFAIAQNLETYAQRNSTIINGMNTLSAQTFFECTISTATGTSFTLNFYSNYDHILVKDEAGLLSVRF